ncbi:MAG: hypothetical protein K2G03_05445 [Bacilli bacterium]|nr:hypothetical protein [Bacilli bacterium]MDE6142029.1 hypothetical protein [Bacilli bacterium]
MRNEKGNIVLLTVISVATLLVAVAGATFAYFSATMPGSESPTTIEVTGGTVFVECSGSSTISGPQTVQPNASLGKRTLTVNGNVTGSTNLNYDAKLIVKNNTYADGELVYTITSTNTSNNGSTISSTSAPVAIPSGTSTINLGNGKFAGPVPSGAVHTYTIEIKYVNSEGVEATEKTFNAQLSVVKTTN